MALQPHAAAPPATGTPPGPVVLWTVLLATAGASTMAVLLASGNTELFQPRLRVALLAWTTLPFIGAGLIAWRRRPDSRFGPLLIAAGLVTPVSTLQWSDTAVLNTVGQLCDLLLPALWLHVFLAYPTGRVTGRARRVVVAAGYAVALLLQLVVLVLGGFDDRHLLAIAVRPDIAETVQNVQLLALMSLSLIGAVALWQRQRATGPVLRRPVALLVDAFGAGLVMVAALLAAGTFQLPGFEILRLVTFAVVGLAPPAFLLGLLDQRLARSGVGELVVRLNAGPPADLRDLIARALRDDSLTVVYWLPEYGDWADGHGRPATLPGAGAYRAVTVVEQRGEPLAALLHHPSLLEEPELVAAVSAAAAIALENDRLQVELRARLQDLHGSRSRLIDAAQDERRRLERDLHDGAQQRLIALSLELGLLEGTLNGDRETRERLGRARQEVAVSLRELRDIARGIHPAVVSGHGLAVALESVAGRTAMPLDLQMADVPRLPENIEVAAYYVVCESLANTAKHAGASAAAVDVRMAAGLLVVQVSDNGVGGADLARGTGLRGLADRVEALDGRLRVWTPVGGGTCVRAEFPGTPL
ncbi:MAG TPA: histidine kinase [Mycobacteriales bacterium]|nr:histidine kinase [Mycobacteriales bacterium]